MPADPDGAIAGGAGVAHLEPGDRLVITCEFEAEGVVANLTGVGPEARTAATLPPDPSGARPLRGGRGEHEALCLAQLLVQPVEAFQYLFVVSAR